MKKFWFILLYVFLCINSTAQQTGIIMYDATQSEIMGATNLQTLHRAVYSFQDKYIPDTLFSEKNLARKLTGMGYRTLKVGLLDFQEDFLIVLAQHEIFGHGARYREFGYIRNSFHLSPFFGGDGGFARHGDLTDGEVITPQERITILFSGNEANLVLANNLTNSVLLNNSMHYREALLYILAQNNQLYYIWLSKLDKVNHPTFGPGDMHSYLSELNSLYREPGQEAISIDDLARQSLISLLNPVQLYSAFTLIYTYGIKAEKNLHTLPMIPIGKIRYLPVFNYSLTPFGSQYHFSNYFKTRDKLFTGEFLLGDNHFHEFYGLNVQAFNLLTSRQFQAGLYASVWDQPALELQDQYITTFENKMGGMIKADLHLRPFKLPHSFGGFLQAGYKTKGYVQGESLGEGMIFRFGLSFIPQYN